MTSAANPYGAQPAPPGRRGARPLAGGRVARRALLALLGLGALLALAEATLRALDLCTVDQAVPLRIPGQADAEPFSRRDELLIYALRPGATTFPWYSIDDRGYRSPPVADSKPAGTLRVIVTGDSTTFGIGMRGDEAWAGVLRRAVAGLCAGERASEVVNAAVTGYSTLQNRLQLRRDLAPLDPDVVVVLVSGANDATLLEGPGDAAVSAAQQQPLRRLARLRLACLAGLGSYGWVGFPARARPGSTTARPRVTVAEVADNLHAMADMLPGRLVLGLFIPKPTYPERETCEAIAAAVQAVAAERGVPLADARPAVDALLPCPLYADPVHPSRPGHLVIARTVLRALLPRLGLSAERMAWARAWWQAQEGRLPEHRETLAGPGAPARFLELLALYRAGDVDGRLQADGGNAGKHEGGADDERGGGHGVGLPESVVAWDPLHGSRCRARSRARALLEDAPEPVLQEIAAHVRPPDPLLACFPDDAAFLAADAQALALGRALVVYGAELGLPPLRLDVRRGLAAEADGPGDAIALLHALLALEPHDAEARLDLAVALRGAHRYDEERAEYEALAAGPPGALADFARGKLAFDDGRLHEAEPAFRRAIEQAPSLGWAHTLLGRLLLRQDRLDEAAREQMLGAMMLGTPDLVPAILADIEARRRELAREGAASGPGAGDGPDAAVTPDGEGR